ncbi:MAG: hypothetical protein QXO24_03270 [Candidatus Micrarchaeaceae archaeon]
MTEYVRITIALKKPLARRLIDVKNVKKITYSDFIEWALRGITLNEKEVELLKKKYNV